MPAEQQINPIAAFLVLFPGSLLIVPLFFHYWYVTKHQNIAPRAAAGVDPFNEVTGPRAPVQFR